MGTLIDLSNYDSLLTESMATRGETPPGASDGNIFFDTANGKIELITAEELSTVRLPTGIKSGLITCSVNKAAKTFTRSSGSFETDGFTAGKTIRTYGFENAGNNVNFAVIESVAGAVITLTSDPGLVDETGNGDEKVVEFGASAVANPLANQEGIFIGAVYAFERQQRRVNEFLRQYDAASKGTYKYAGAYELINGRLFSTTGSSTTDDRAKLRGSGWLERDVSGNVTKTLFGDRSLGNIENTSQPFYQLTEGGAPINFKKVGSVDEGIDVTGATTFLSNKVRTYGMNYDEKTLVDSGIAEMSGFSAGFALGESPHLTTIPETYPLADVWVTPIVPFDGMGLEKYATGQIRGGFNEADGTFTWIMHNAGGATLDQCVAWLDAAFQDDVDLNQNTPPVVKGKRVKTPYYYDAAGRIVTRRGFDLIDLTGLHIDNLPTADRQRVRFVDDNGDLKTYPFMVDLKTTVGPNAAADPNGWYHVWEAAGYGTPAAVTVLDSQGNEMKGSTYGISPPYVISREYDWVGGGSIPLDIVIECEGDGIATQAKTEATIIESAIVSVVCAPALETNI